MTTDDVLDKAALHAAAMLDALGLVGDDRTAWRLVKALDELAGARNLDPGRHLAVEFPTLIPADPGLVCVTDLPFTSLCEHHMLPFAGIATLAYLPTATRAIPGLSKLARLLGDYAARPQVQERLTYQVAAALHIGLQARGAACAVRAVHACMALRGAATGPDAAMVTTEFVGQLADDPWRGEFMAKLNTARWR